MTEEAGIPQDPNEGSMGAGFAEEEEGFSSNIPEDAFFSPDDPIVQTEGDIPKDAIFSPDDPLSREDVGEGVVTGMGGVHEQDPGRGMGLAWEIRNTAGIMEALARDLRDHGMEALRIHRETEPMEAMLRSFVAGFLMGKVDDDA